MGKNVGDPEGEVIWCSSYDEAVEMLQRDGIVNLLALTGVNTIPKLKDYWSREGNICHFRVLDRDESRGLVVKVYAVRRPQLPGRFITVYGLVGCAEKFSGDDPDITAGKEIFATLRLNWEGSVQFFGGDGVGTVTLPGLGLEVGGPAINNGPRKHCAPLIPNGELEVVLVEE